MTLGEKELHFIVSLGQLSPSISGELPTSIVPELWNYFTGEHQEISAHQLKEAIPLACEQLPDQELIEAAWQAWQESGQGKNLHPILLVEGSFASGKTALAQSLAEATEAILLEEEWEGNSQNLGQFYTLLRKANEQGWNDGARAEIEQVQAEVQAWFANNTLTRMLKAIVAAQEKPVVVDVSLLSDAVYELTQRMLGLASEESFTCYQEETKSRWQVLPPVGWIHVYNGVHSANTLSQRNTQRGRSLEAGMPSGYLELLLYNCFNMVSWLAQQGIPTLFIDAEVGNFSETNQVERLSLAQSIWQEVAGLTCQ